MIEGLARAARAELSRHPQAHLLGVPGAEVEVSLRLPLFGGDAVGAEQVDAVKATLREEIEALLAAETALRPGHVSNLRTGEVEGKGTAPPDARFVFGGWSPSGVPRFLDFAQLLLERNDPRQHQLYAKPPHLLTVQMDRDELRRELLPAFEEDELPLEIRGQVVAGWFPVERRDETDAVLALTFQVVTVGRTGKKRRHVLNVLGRGPDGEPLEEVVARYGIEPPWKSAVDWAQKALGTVGSEDHGQEKRLHGILGGLARRLEQRQRSRRRRTHHAEERHRGGERPTRMAMRDLATAGKDEVLVDERRDTLVVLGDRGRAHVFNDIGKLVTSIRYTPESIERKRERGIWRPATTAEVQTLRKTVGV